MVRVRVFSSPHTRSNNQFPRDSLRDFDLAAVLIVLL